MSVDPSLHPPARSGPAYELEIDALLREFQQVCEAVCYASAETTGAKQQTRAIVRNDLRARLLATQPAASLGEPAERPTLTENIVYTKIESSSARVSEDAPGDERDVYPPITLAECDSFERHAEHGARIDLTGEGVEYTPIQPYDLVRFCWTIRDLTALRADRDRLREALIEIRDYQPARPDWLRGLAATALSSSPSSATLEKP